MLIHSDISFRKQKFDDGFGFICMKAAYAFGIKGCMVYGPDTGVVIQAEGEHQGIDDFVKWLNINANVNKEEIICKPGEYAGKFNEFDIYRQEYIPT